MSRRPTSVDVWRQYDVEQPWTISLCDDDGEIKCLGGADSLQEAWEAACEYAVATGVPAREIDRSGRVVDEHRP